MGLHRVGPYGRAFRALTASSGCDYQAGLLGFQGLDFLFVVQGFRASDADDVALLRDSRQLHEAESWPS